MLVWHSQGRYIGEEESCRGDRGYLGPLFYVSYCYSLITSQHVLTVLLTSGATIRRSFPKQIKNLGISVKMLIKVN